MGMIFDGLNKYQGGYTVTDKREFTAEEIAMVREAEIVVSNYGLSVCFMMKAGGAFYIPLSKDSSGEAGDRVDLSTAEILLLSKEGADDIKRIRI